MNISNVLKDSLLLKIFKEGTIPASSFITGSVAYTGTIPEGSDIDIVIYDQVKYPYEQIVAENLIDESVIKQFDSRHVDMCIKDMLEVSPAKEDNYNLFPLYVNVDGVKVNLILARSFEDYTNWKIATAVVIKIVELFPNFLNNKQNRVDIFNLITRKTWNISPDDFIISKLIF